VESVAVAQHRVEGQSLAHPLEKRRRGRAVGQAGDLAAQAAQAAPPAHGERANRQRRGAVPERIEDALRLPDHVAHQQQVEIVEVGGLGGVEVFVADVAAADDCQAAVGDPRLVVHAAVGAEGSQHQLERARDRALAHAAGIEQPELDVAMGVERQEDAVAAARVDVVDQDAHAHATVGGSDDLVRQQAAGQVASPDIVHQVEAAPRSARRERAHGEGVEVVRHHGEAVAGTASCHEGADRAVEQGARRGYRQGKRGPGARPLEEPVVRIDRHEGQRDEQSDDAADQKYDIHAGLSDRPPGPRETKGSRRKNRHGKGLPSRGRATSPVP